MKQKITLLLLTVILFNAYHANAKIWRINNNANASNGSNFGGTAANPVFQQLFGTTNGANSSNLVVSGDTVHIEGSSIVYDGGNLTKKLVVIGPGYFLTENPSTSNNALYAIMNSFNFAAGSSGSQLIGVYIGNSTAGISVSTSDVLIKRCRIDEAVNLTTVNISDIRIVQNFFARTSTSSMVNTSTAGFPVDVIFNNNIVLAPFILPVNYTMLECKNNIFAGLAFAGSPTIQMNVGSFQNNILVNPAATVNINSGTNLNVTYCIGSSNAQFGTGSNNIVVPDMTTLFITGGTSDGKYQLKPGSTTGSDGTDRGAFGGAAVTSRYTLSGLAPIPVIYDISTSGVATPTGLPVTIKARTIK